MVSKLMEKTVTCPWDMCKFNNDEGICSKTSIVLEVLIQDDDIEGLQCASFEKRGGQR
jgi:hypothetical protein